MLDGSVAGGMRGGLVLSMGGLGVRGCRSKGGS